MNKELKQLFETVEDTTVYVGMLDLNMGVYSKKNNSRSLMVNLNLHVDEPYVIQNNKSVFRESYNKDNHYICFIDQQSGKGKPTGYNTTYSTVEDLKDDIYYHYQNSLIIFEPRYQYDEVEEVFHKNVDVLEIIPIPTDMNKSTYLKRIPEVSLKQADFERKLRNGEKFELKAYPGSTYKYVDYIYCDGYVYFSNGFKYIENQDLYWQYEAGTMLRKIRIPKKSRIITSTYKIDQVFIDELYLQDLRESFIDVSIVKEEEPVVIKEEPVAKVKDTKSMKFKFVLNRPENLVKKQPIVYKRDDIEGEYKMIQGFRNSIIKNNLCYDDRDLINLHVCAKSLPLVILAGMSGTGKTQLALQYAHMIQASEKDGSLLFVPVSPSFSEPDDIFGYLNHNTNRYIPSDTGLVDLLVHALNHPDKMHMVIFDEMNLSQIEYWFSTMMSVLEKDEDSRYLYLYNENAVCMNKDVYPSKIKISNNVIFIGTINLDETTKTLSDRLLDRSFVINLSKRKFVDFFVQDNVVLNTDEQICEDSNAYNRWRYHEQPIKAFTKEELQFLDELHDIISQYDEQKGVSFRVVKNIGTYLANIPFDKDSNPLINREDAFDIVLKQTIMKKLTGPEYRLLPLVGTIKDNHNQIENSLLNDLFDRYASISHFTLCKEVLVRKAEDLNTYGYAR